MDDPVRRIGGAAFLLAAAILVAGPIVGTGRRPRADAIRLALGVALALVPASAIFGASVPAALASGAVLAGFLLLTAGLAAAVGRMGRSAAFGVAAAGAIGALCLASFHLGDPFLEWGGPGRSSSLALTVLHVMNPASAGIGDALAVDWLRFPIMYSGFSGALGAGLSSAQYYPWSYFPWWGGTLLTGGAGISLLLATRSA